MTKNPDHVFWKIFISYSRFPIFAETDRRDLSAPTSRKNVNICDFPMFEIFKNNIFENVPVFFELFSICLCLQKYQELVMGGKGPFKNPEIIGMMGLGFSHEEINK